MIWPWLGFWHLSHSKLNCFYFAHYIGLIVVFIVSSVDLGFCISAISKSNIFKTHFCDVQNCIVLCMTKCHNKRHRYLARSLEYPYNMKRRAIIWDWIVNWLVLVLFACVQFTIVLKISKKKIAKGEKGISIKYE